MSFNFFKNTIPDKVSRNEFLPGQTFYKGLFKGTGTDTFELFEQNLKLQPDNWYYRHAPVNYTVNRHGYRTAEFEDIDWAESIVMFGCSTVFGTGVDDKHTIASQLSTILDKPVINMGIGGTSILFSLHNSIMLRDSCPLPLAVIQLWTDYSRTSYYKKTAVDRYGAWNLEKGNYMDLWAEHDSHGKTHAIIASKTSKIIWENTTYFEGSFFTNTANALKCKLFDSTQDARDLVHCGIDANYKTATLLAKQLKL